MIRQLTPWRINCEIVLLCVLFDKNSTQNLVLGRNLEEIQWRFSRGALFAIATTIEIGQTTYTRLHLTKR